MFFIGLGIFVSIFGVLFLLKKINVLSVFVSDCICLLVFVRPIPIPGYGMELFTEIKTVELIYTIYAFFLVVIIIIAFILTLRRYFLFNITMGKTENVCINRYKGITVDYSKNFKENNKGFKEYKNGAITIDFNDNQNNFKITSGDNGKGATLSLRKVKDRELRKDIIRSIKEEISNNENKGRWYRWGVLYIVYGGLIIFREIVYMRYL